MTMDAPDEIIHQSMRLRIVSALNSLPVGESMDFTSLKSALKATDGNLGAHITTLENAGYLQVAKDFVGRKPRTSLSLTHTGRRAFEKHVSYLRGLLDGGAT
jgi:DNA-binding transcriptional ArsR family regulator